LNALYHKRLHEFVSLNKGAEYFLHHGKKITNEIAFELQIDQLNMYSAILQSDIEGNFVFRNEKVVSQNNVLANENSFKKESDLKLYSGIKTKPLNQLFSNLKRYHFHDTGPDSPFMSMTHVYNDAHFLYEKGGNLGAMLHQIFQQDKKAYFRIVKNIQSIAPFFSDFYLKPNKQNLLRLQWQDKYSSTSYGPEDLSDGTLRFIALATLFLQPEPPKIIIIDEPELGLHPAAISKLSGMINVAIAKGVQVIVATQSPDLINCFEPEDLITVDNLGHSIFRRLNKGDLSQWIEEYSIGELWQRNIIEGGQPK